MDQYYKLRHKTTGLFSSGTHPPIFTKHGKIWLIEHLKAHLRYIQKRYKNFSVYSDCELICFTASTEPATLTIEDLFYPLEQEMVVSNLKGRK